MLQEVHAHSLVTSSALSGFAVPGVLSPLEVVAVLNGAGVRFMLVGTHGIGGWTRKPRATQAVDVLVAARHHNRAVKALRTAFLHLEPEDLPAVTRLRDRATGDVTIDVLKPNQQLFRDALKHTHTVRAGGQLYQIPSVGLALALKFAPMVSPHHLDEDRYVDAHDFISMVKANPRYRPGEARSARRPGLPGGG